MPRAEPTVPRIPRIAAAAIATLSAAAAFGVLFFGSNSVWPDAPIVPIFVPLALAAAAPAYVVLRAAGGVRAAAFVWLGALGAAPALFLTAVRVLASPIIEDPRLFLCATGAYDALLSESSMFTATSALGVGAAVGFVSAPARERGRRVRVLAWIAFVGVVLLGGVGAIRAARLPHAGAWAGSLPIVAHVEGSPDPFSTSRTRITPSVAIDRLCDGRGCVVRLVEVAPDLGADALGAPRSCSDLDPGCPRSYLVGDHPSPLVVRRDPISEIFVVETGDGRVAFGPGLSPMRVMPTDVARSISAPPSIRWTALLGAALALFAFAMRLPIVRTMRRVESAGRSGTADEDGVAFDDGRLPARGACDRTVPLGPVVAIPRREAAVASYRDDGTRGDWEVFSGTRDSVLAALEARARGWSAFAFAATALALVPLLVAALLFRIVL